MERTKAGPQFIVVEESGKEPQVVPIQTEKKQNENIFGDPQYGGFGVIKDKDGNIKLIGVFDKEASISYGKSDDKSVIRMFGRTDMVLESHCFPFEVKLLGINKVIKVNISDPPTSDSSIGVRPKSPPPTFKAAVELKQPH